MPRRSTQRSRSAELIRFHLGRGTGNGLEPWDDGDFLEASGIQEENLPILLSSTRCPQHPNRNGILEAFRLANVNELDEQDWVFRREFFAAWGVEDRADIGPAVAQPRTNVERLARSDRALSATTTATTATAAATTATAAATTAAQQHLSRLLVQSATHPHAGLAALWKALHEAGMIAHLPPEFGDIPALRGAAQPVPLLLKIKRTVVPAAWRTTGHPERDVELAQARQVVAALLLAALEADMATQSMVAGATLPSGEVHIPIAELLPAAALAACRLDANLHLVLHPQSGAPVPANVLVDAAIPEFRGKDMVLAYTEEVWAVLEAEGAADRGLLDATRHRLRQDFGDEPPQDAVLRAMHDEYALKHGARLMVARRFGADSQAFKDEPRLAAELSERVGVRCFAHGADLSTSVEWKRLATTVAQWVKPVFMALQGIEPDQVTTSGPATLAPDGNPTARPDPPADVPPATPLATGATTAGAPAFAATPARTANTRRAPARLVLCAAPQDERWARLLQDQLAALGLEAHAVEAWSPTWLADGAADEPGGVAHAFATARCVLLLLSPHLLRPLLAAPGRHRLADALTPVVAGRRARAVLASACDWRSVPALGGLEVYNQVPLDQPRSADPERRLADFAADLLKFGTGV